MDRYLTEAKSAIQWSKSKKQLFEAVEYLSGALKEVQNLRNPDLSEMKGELNFYRKHCDQASKLMRDTTEKAPFATKVLRKGLPILEENFKKHLEEIQEKAKIACKESIGTPTEEIVRTINREVQKLEISNQEEMIEKVEDLVFILKSTIPNIPENKRIFEKIEKIKHETDLLKQYDLLIFIISALSKVQIDLIIKDSRDVFLKTSKKEETGPTIGIITALPKEYAAVKILMEVLVSRQQ